jgi:prolipoprotein diacylglyceryltransferase
MSRTSGADEPTDFKNSEDASSKLFDLRLLIGALFVVYGIVLFIAGFFTSDQARSKAAGLNINLWLGVAMFVLGALFLVWARLRPLRLGGPSAVAEAERTGPSE